MWPNTNQNNPKEDKLKEYHRQQDKLKTMGPTNDKGRMTSTDVMIENLLNHSDIFRKVKPNSNQNIEQPTPEQSMQPELPLWLQLNNSATPEVYKQVWALVQSAPSGNGYQFAVTYKLSQLLLTSGLHTDVLGYIWNLANKCVPGQLTQQELYIVLALVGLAQNGCTFNNLSVLNYVPSPPVPVLQLPGYSAPIKQSCVRNELKTSESSGDIVRGFSGLLVSSIDPAPTAPVNSSNFPCIGSSPTAELEDDFSEFHSAALESTPKLEEDEFTDFQSIVTPTQAVDPLEVVISQRRDIPKIPLPKTLTGKLSSLKSSILRISPESERRLKTLSQSESLTSLPESKIPANNKVSTLPGISVVGGNRGVGSRLANHKLGSKSEKPSKHKHQKIKLSIQETALSSKKLAQTNVDELFPKCFQKSANGGTTFLLKETKISESGVADLINNTPSISGQLELPSLGTFTETVLPTQPATADELFTMEEDKYSALRDIDVGLRSEIVQTRDAEDFGDFLSADWGEMAKETSSPLETQQSLLVSNGAEVMNDILGPLSSLEAKKTLLMENSTEITTAPCLPDDLKADVTHGMVQYPKADFETRLPEVLGADLTEGILNYTPRLLNLPTSESLNKDLTQLASEVFKPDLMHGIPNSESVEKVESKEVSQDTSWGDWTVGLEPTVSKPVPVDSVAWADWTTSSAHAPSSELLFDTFTDQGAVDLLGSVHVPHVETPSSDWTDLESRTMEVKQYTVSRHSSLPSLDLKLSPGEESEEDTVGRRCYQVCCNILHEAVEILSNVPSHSVMREVLSTSEADNYFNYLNTAYHISKRISHSLASDSSLLHDDSDQLWRGLDRYCFEYNIKLKEDADSFPGGGGACTVCQGPICSESVDHGSAVFHPSCANLWVNCLDPTLPCIS